MLSHCKRLAAALNSIFSNNFVKTILLPKFGSGKDFLMQHNLKTLTLWLEIISTGTSG